MSITLDDISALLHLPVMGQMCDLQELEFEEARTALLQLLGVDGGTTGAEMEDARGPKVRLSWLREIYVQRDVHACDRYAWGVATLAHLYEQLGDASLASTKQMAEYLTLFQIGDTLCRHLPERVLRQFGFQQDIPRSPTTIPDVDIVAIDHVWLHFRAHVVSNVRHAASPSDCVDGYIQWFRRV
ncbi:uncharacterized protein LOC124819908 [Vigna umbellata]|uniref:uncharacterized protein LOC124819908 n=1 Tax=Vigna umbellata TaxID=87088 RepID=UPI001F5F3AC8|nr:uncharacterized protein LOC124819908 [Vigna umbellata]